MELATLPDAMEHTTNTAQRVRNGRMFWRLNHSNIGLMAMFRDSREPHDYHPRVVAPFFDLPRSLVMFGSIGHRQNLPQQEDIGAITISTGFHRAVRRLLFGFLGRVISVLTLAPLRGF